MDTTVQTTEETVTVTFTLNFEDIEETQLHRPSGYYYDKKVTVGDTTFGILTDGEHYGFTCDSGYAIEIQSLDDCIDRIKAVFKTQITGS